MKRSQTSDHISSLAGRYLNFSLDDLDAAARDMQLAERTRDDIRSMAASLLRQDETKGLRGLARKLLGK